MHKTFLALALALGCATTAAAGTVENSFGHIIVSRSADGHETQWRYSADGSYTTTTDGQTVSGTWTRSNDQLCLTPAGGAQTCYPDTDNKAVGDTWSVTMPDGQITTVTMVAGQ